MALPKYSKEYLEAELNFLTAVNNILKLFGCDTIDKIPKNTDENVLKRFPSNIIRDSFENMYNKYEKNSNIAMNIDTTDDSGQLCILIENTHTRNISNYYDMVENGEDYNGKPVFISQEEEYLRNLSDSEIVDGIVILEKQRIKALLQNQEENKKRWEEGLEKLKDTRNKKLSPVDRSSYIHKLKQGMEKNKK